MDTRVVKFDTIENTGIPLDELVNMDWEEIDRRIEKKIGTKLKFQMKQDDRLPFCGSVLLRLKRLIFREDVQARFDAMRPLDVLR